MSNNKRDYYTIVMFAYLLHQSCAFFTVNVDSATNHGFKNLIYKFRFYNKKQPIQPDRNTAKYNPTQRNHIDFGVIFSLRNVYFRHYCFFCVCSAEFLLKH